MPEPKDLVIMKELTKRLEMISLPSGMPVGTFVGRVVRGRTVLGKEDPVPLYSLLESPKPDLQPVPGGINGTTLLMKWDLLLQGFGLDDKLNPTDSAYEMKAAAIHQLSRIKTKDASQGNALYPEDYLLPYNGDNLLKTIHIFPGVVRPPDKEVSPTAFCLIPLTVEYVLDISNPFV